jgi:hypothetical protein
MKAKSGLLFSIALLCLLTACDSTQVVNLSGRVYNSKTQLPVANATVSDGLYGFKNSAVTDTTGYYSYETYCEEHTVNIEAPGYEAKSATLITPFWPSSNALTLDVTLEPMS